MKERAAGCVSCGQKWRTIFCRHYKSTFNHCDVMRPLSYRIREN